MRKIDKKIQRFIFGLVLLALMTNIAAAEIDPGPCEIALFRCIQDPLWAGASEAIFHCLLGYLFCKKYIDRIRG